MSKLEALLEGQELSAEFKTKLGSLVESIEQEKEEKFKAIYEAKIEEEKVSLQEAQEKYIAEEVIPKYEALTESYFEDEVMPTINDYISEAVRQALSEKEVSIQESAKVELADSLLAGIKSLMESHNIEVPEGATDIVAESKAKVEEVETKLNESVKEVVELRKELVAMQKQAVISKVASDLTESQSEKLSKAAEKLSFVSESEFLTAVEDLKTSLGLVTESTKEELVVEDKLITESKTEQVGKRSYLQELTSLALK